VTVHNLDAHTNHPVWGANNSIALGHCVSQLPTGTEIRQFHCTACGQQHVRALDVTVYLAHITEITQTEKNLACNRRNVLFLKNIVLGHV
jgi:hypothetical protein